MPAVRRMESITKDMTYLTYSKTILAKVLKKMGILRVLNVYFDIKINQIKVKIPVLKNIGYPNLFLKPDLFNHIFRDFIGDSKGVFVDVGVNIGQTLLKVKTLHKDLQYIGFEPNEVCANYAQKLIHANCFKNCEIRQMALVDQPRILELSTNEASDAAGSIISGLRPNYFRQKTQIQGVNFDSLGIDKPISFVKIDVEGAELEVLIGMSEAVAQWHPLILCEVLDSFSDEVLGFTQQRANKLCEWLGNQDYCIIQLQQGKENLKSFRQLQTITIKQWTQESYEWNDYLFYHQTQQAKVEHYLKMLQA